MVFYNSERILSLPKSEPVRTEFFPESAMPLIFRPVAEDSDFLDWADSHSETIQRALDHYGALLFRGFKISEPAQFERFAKTISGELIEYRERTSPRSVISGRIYTSTDYPATESIFPHNESSYNFTFPMKIFFCCQTPARQGGSTPIADTRKIFRRINPQTRERLIEKRYMYVRNYDDDIGLSWQTVFQTTDRSAIEEYCRRSEIEFEWMGENGLRTRQVRPVATRHPRTDEWVWFNHATFFHVSTLEPRVRDALLKMVPEEELPNNTYYGDGSPIEPEVLDELRAAYRQELVVFPWLKGDVLMLDNMLTAHAREPFSGPRKILTAMAEPRSWNSLKEATPTKRQ